jgi:phosphoserine phosphatase
MKKLLMFVALTACIGAQRPPKPDHCAPTALRTDLPWYGNNRADLTRFLDSAGCASPSFDPKHPPVALWDWDNTIGKNDFGDAMVFWFLAHAKILQPAGFDWHASSALLTDPAAAALSAACGTLVPVGAPLPTDTNVACADEILAIYIDGVTRAKEPAWKAVNARRMEPAYAWAPQLMAGYTHAQLQDFTRTAITALLAAPQGTEQTIGTHEHLNGWLRIYDQQKDLIAAAHSRGYEAWVITASPQDVIGTIAPLAGIPADHVIGIRSLVDANGKLTAQTEGCGDVPDGWPQTIPHMQGKRCYVNKLVFHDNAWTRRPDGQRWVLAAGDSDSDVEFLRDATYKLVINRNRGDLMCHAYNDEHDSWRINPMFIEPKPAQTAPYACGSAAIDEHGAPVPVRDEAGNAIANQRDAVHP